MFTSVAEIRTEMFKKKKSCPKEGLILSMLLQEVQNIAKNDGNREPTQNDILTALKKMHKMATQSITEMQKVKTEQSIANVAKIQEELDYLNTFIPAKMSDDELKKLISLKIKELSIVDMNGFKTLMQNLKGNPNIDMSKVQPIYKSLIDEL